MDQKILEQIKDVLSQRESDPGPPYWLADEEDPAYDKPLCWDCLDKDNVYEGGYSWEGDSCLHCEKCGKLLEYTLTGYGVDSELDHYDDHPPENLNDPDECYHLARVAYCVSGDQVSRFLAIMKATTHD